MSTADMWGADVAALERLGRDMTRHGRSLVECVALVRAALYAAPWDGADSASCRATWDGIQRSQLLAAAEALQTAGDSLIAQAQEQLRTSEAGSIGGTPHAVFSRTEDRTTLVGVIGRGSDGSRVEVVQMSDGTWVVKANYSTAFQLSGSDALDVASLAFPEQKALAAVAGAIGGSVTMFGISHGFSFQVADEASARRLADGFEREGGELGGMDPLSRSEIQQVLREEEAKGTHIDLIGSDVRRDGVTFEGSIGKDGMEISGSVGTASLTHGYDVAAQTATDTMSTIDMKSGVSIGGISGDVAVAQQVSVVRDAGGHVIGLQVVTTAAPSVGVDLSSGNVVDALSSGGGNGFSNITGLLSSHAGYSQGVVAQTTLTYDLTAGQGGAISDAFGGYDPSRVLSADQIHQLYQQVTSANGIHGSQVSEMFQSDTATGGGRFISYESEVSNQSLALLGRTESSF